MDYNGAERRQHKRVYFTNSLVIRGSFGPLDLPEETTEGKVLNLSLGGLYCTIDRNTTTRFKVNETIIMNDLTTSNTFQLSANIILEVRRVEDQPIFDHIGYGCQFIDIDDNSKARIAKFLEWEMANISNSNNK